MGAEVQLWRYLRPELQRAGVRSERLTDRLVQARPDVLWIDTQDGLTGLVELKAPKPRQKDLGMRPGQAAFIWEWATQRRGLASILVRHPGDSWALYLPGSTLSWVGVIESEHYTDLAHAGWWPDFPGGSVIRDALRQGRSVAVPGSPTGAIGGREGPPGSGRPLSRPGGSL